MDRGTDVDALITGALNRVNDAANMFDGESEISKLNRTGRIEKASEEFRYLYKTAIEANRASDGAFLPTIGALTDFWGFGTEKEREHVTPEQIDSVLANTSVGNVLYDAALGSFSVQPGTRLDFGAIAKGYGVDCVAQALETAGCRDFMVEIGGEVCVKGCNPAGERWKIQIDAPVPDPSGTHQQLMVVELTDVSVATSGNYRNFRYDATGRLVFHTISPVTGFPAESDLLSATVFAQNTTVADALATACMVMGREKASAMISGLQANGSGPGGAMIYGAIFVTQGADGTYNIHKVGINADHVGVVVKE